MLPNLPQATQPVSPKSGCMPHPSDSRVPSLTSTENKYCYY